MYQVVYKNKIGEVVLGGGKAPFFNITSISGLELPPREYKTIEFAGENGLTVIGKKDSERTITISGTVNGTQDVIEGASKVFYEDGELWCYFNHIERKISCRINKSPEFEKLGKTQIYNFAVQFICDYPYFTDFENHILPIYSRENLVFDKFTLPCVFTERICSGNIFNAGDKLLYPKLIIDCEGDGTSTDSQFSISNDTTGAFIGVDYDMRNGERIEIDTATRKITSSIKGNITNYITDDTDLSKFYLDIGDNYFHFVNSDISQVLNAKIIFNPEYLSVTR